MSQTPITLATCEIEFLLDYLREEQLAGRHARIVEKLARALAETPRPTHYTLCRDTAGWRIGAGDGIPAPPMSGEVARGLNALELAVAYPGDPVRLADFLTPGEAFKDEHGLARKMISITRKWIGEEIDADMESLLGACTVSLDTLGRPALICAPLPVRVVTSLAS